MVSNVSVNSLEQTEKELNRGWKYYTCLKILGFSLVIFDICVRKSTFLFHISSIEIYIESNYLVTGYSDNSVENCRTKLGLTEHPLKKPIFINPPPP